MVHFHSGSAILLALSSASWIHTERRGETERGSPVGIICCQPIWRAFIGQIVPKTTARWLTPSMNSLF